MKINAKHLLPALYLAAAGIAYIAASEVLFYILFVLSLPTILIVSVIMDTRSLPFYVVALYVLGTTFQFFVIGHLWDLAVEKFTAVRAVIGLLGLFLFGVILLSFAAC